jgi:hypothetical protein
MPSSHPRLWLVAALLAGFPALPLGGLPARAEQPPDLIHQPYQLDTGLASRSISFENPSGAPGEGGKTASPIGVGRKGQPMKGMTFWYEPVPSVPLPPMPDVKARTADIWSDAPAKK